uniref:Uncharacterized protein n=1 Tax=Oryza barthii TaxID=65489 RepID=A0A0D3H4K7_9ORYZ
MSSVFYFLSFLPELVSSHRCKELLEYKTLLSRGPSRRRFSLRRRYHYLFPYHYEQVFRTRKASFPELKIFIVKQLYKPCFFYHQNTRLNEKCQSEHSSEYF